MMETTTWGQNVFRYDIYDICKSVKIDLSYCMFFFSSAAVFFFKASKAFIGAIKTP